MITSSLRLRLAVAGAVALVAALIAAALALVALFERHVERRLVDELGHHLDQLVASVTADPSGKLALSRQLLDPRFQTPLSGLYWQISGPAGSLRSRSLWDASLALPGEPAADGSAHVSMISGPGSQRLLALDRRIELGPSEGSVVVHAIVAADRAEIAEAKSEFAGDMLPYLLLLAAVLTAAGIVQIDLGLRPLVGLRKRVAAIRSGESTRLGPDYPSEIVPLATELDTLLAARERELERARTRAADLAHGLRTPLQVLEGDIARLEEKGEHAIAADIARVADGMRRHVERELVRARMGQRERSARADVAEAIERVAAVTRRMAVAASLDWSIEAPAGLAAAIDHDDLTEALGNLIENAARFARSRIAIAACKVASSIEITITDDGEGFPSDKVGEVLQRGRRLDERGSGSGLGLAIVSEIAEAWNARFDLVPSDAGVTARLTIPAAMPR